MSKEVISLQDYRQQKEQREYWLANSKLERERYITINSGEIYYCDNSGHWCLLPYDSSGEYSNVDSDFSKILDFVRDNKKE